MQKKIPLLSSSFPPSSSLLLKCKRKSFLFKENGLADTTFVLEGKHMSLLRCHEREMRRRRRLWEEMRLASRFLVGMDRSRASLAALFYLAPLLLLSTTLVAVAVESATDSLDGTLSFVWVVVDVVGKIDSPLRWSRNWFAVQALGVLYASLNSPRQLSGWTRSGGDPCGTSWLGVSCSGSAVVAM